MTTSVQERTATDRPREAPTAENSQSASGETRAAIEAGIAALEPEWRALADLHISDAPESATDDAEADYVLLHPDFGVALLDAAPGRRADPIAGFRRFLDSQNFAQIFTGTLPVAHLTLTTEQAADLRPAVMAALVGQPKLTIEDPDWAEALATILVASDPETAAETVWPDAEPAVTLPDLGPEPDLDLEAAFSGPPGLDQPGDEDPEPTIAVPDHNLETDLEAAFMTPAELPEGPAEDAEPTIALRPPPPAKPDPSSRRAAAGAASETPANAHPQPVAEAAPLAPLLLRQRAPSESSRERLGSPVFGAGGGVSYRPVERPGYARRSALPTAIFFALLFAGGAGMVWYVEQEFPTTSLDRLLPDGLDLAPARTSLIPLPEAVEPIRPPPAQQAKTQDRPIAPPAPPSTGAVNASGAALPAAPPSPAQPGDAAQPLNTADAAKDVPPTQLPAPPSGQAVPGPNSSPVPARPAATPAPVSPDRAPADSAGPAPDNAHPAGQATTRPAERAAVPTAGIPAAGLPAAPVPAATAPMPAAKPAAPKRAAAVHSPRKRAVEVSARPARPSAAPAAEPTSLSHDAPPIDAADLPPAEGDAAVSPPPDPEAEQGAFQPSYPSYPYAPIPPGSSPPTSLLPSPQIAAGKAEMGDARGAGNASNLPTDGRVCRVYTSSKLVQGILRPITGLACRGVDGRWQPVTEGTAD